MNDNKAEVIIILALVFGGVIIVVTEMITEAVKACS